MATYTYNSIPQLQAFIFEKDTRATLELALGYHGPGILIKLSNKHAVPFMWPFPHDKITSTQISDRQQKELVIPLHPIIDLSVLHAAIASAGLGHLLLNLKEG